MSKKAWKGPSVREIAEVAGVGPATVDRVLNNRSGVREKTRNRVLSALDKLSYERREEEEEYLDIHLYCVSGEAFNEEIVSAEIEVNRSIPNVIITGTCMKTNQLEPVSFAQKIAEESADADGIILIAYEHPAFNRVVRDLVAQGKPVVCMTTDLPSSRRSAYIGNDQYAAGSVAGSLIGKALPPEQDRILLVLSNPFRCQQEREMGFRRVLRSDFPYLKIDERMISDDVPEHTYELASKYIESHGLPAAIYNVAGANRGIAKALEEVENGTDRVFVGHELTNYSRHLLETRTMDYVISHDFSAELVRSVRCIRDNIEGITVEPSHSPIMIHTRYNCGL